jgi:hypothetical protein
VRANRFRSQFHKVVMPLLVGALTMGSAVFADDANNPDSFKTPKTAPDTTVTTPGNAPAVDLHFPLDSNSDITTGPAGCPMLVIDGNVWDIKTAAIHVLLEDAPPPRTRRALSDNGKYFAAIIDEGATPKSIGVWNCDTGKKICDIPLDGKQQIDVILFSRNNYLIYSGRSIPDLYVWDVAGNQQMDPLAIKAERNDQGHVAFSPDGQYFTAVVKDKLTLFRTATGKPITQMSPPKHIEQYRPKPANDAAATNNPKPARIEAPNPRMMAIPDNDYVFVYAWLQSMEFSPDGKEIAAVSTYPVPRLIVWDILGHVEVDEILAVPQMAFWENKVEWFPDKSGWFVDGCVIPRDVKKPVMTFLRGMVSPKPWLCDSNHVLAALPSNPGVYQSYEIPWKDIKESLAMMKHPRESLLSPTTFVSVKVDAGDLTGDAPAAAKQIADAFTTRLHRDGIPVSDGNDTVFTLKLSEKPGDTLPIYERQSPFDFRGKDTGQTMTEQKGALVVELTTKGDDTVLWRDTINATSSRSFQEQINDAAIRKSMLDGLSMRLSGINPPYFIPKDEKKLALPVVMQ